jgi:hypothetical protein
VARWTFYKERGQGAVVMVNSNEGAPLIDEILRAVAREYAWPGYFPEDKTASAPAAALDAYLGSYATKTLECRVTRDADALLLTLATQPALRLKAAQQDNFRASDVDVEVVFNRADGVVKSLTLTQGGKGTTAEKK